MSIKKNFIYNLLLVLSQVIFPVLVMPYVNRVLGPVNVGTFNLVDSFVQYFITIAALGIPIYGVREISKAKHKSQEKLNQTFSELIVINIILTITCLLVYVLFIIYSPTIQKNQIYYFLGSLQLIAGVFSLEWYFQGIENFKFIAIRTFFIKIISTVAIYIFVKSISDGLIYYIITTFTFVITAIFNIFYLIKNLSYRKPSFTNLKQHYKSLLTFFTTKFMISVYVTLTTVLLGFLSTEKDVGFFSLAFRIFNIIVVVISSLTIVLLSRSSIMAYADKSKFNNLVDTVFCFNIFLGVPSSIFIYLYAREFVLVLGGDEFLPTVKSLQTLSLLVLIIPFSNLFALNILTPLKKERYFLKATIIGTIISLVLNFYLMPKYGYLGATYAFLITELVVCVALFYYAYKFHKFKFNLLLLLKVLMTCLLFFPIYYFLLPDMASYIRLIIGAFISFLVYILSHIFIIRNSIVNTYILQTFKIKLPAANEK